MNSFGRKFRVSVFGESHGPVVGCTIDGVAPGLHPDLEELAKDIARRSPAGVPGGTGRREKDEPVFLSGLFDGMTTGAPLTIVFFNDDPDSVDYEVYLNHPRPGHADYVAAVKFEDFNDPLGGGHFSGRLTLPIVAAGYFARLQYCDINIMAELVQVGGVTPLIPAHAKNDPKVLEVLRQAEEDGDSLGGVVECVIKGHGLEIGLGEPFWDSVESLLSHAIFSIPGVRGIEFGDGFKASAMRGSEHNDPLGKDGIPTKNGAGGVNGGLTNGAPIVFRVAFKPTSSIRKGQRSFNFEQGRMAELKCKGRHDVCFALRTPVIVESMAAIVLTDLLELSGLGLAAEQGYEEKN